MPITVDCFDCQRRFRVPDSAAGRSLKCPSCGKLIRIPDADPEPDSDPVYAVPPLVPRPSTQPATNSVGNSPNWVAPDDDQARATAVAAAVIATPPTSMPSSPMPAPNSKHVAPVPAEYHHLPAPVVVVDFDMRFSSMVLFLVKLAIAAIPAFLILAAIGSCLAMLIAFLLGLAFKVATGQ